ncbi:5-bromo-4-chloroindolyl phosphate hydrolysis family protein [Bacillus sp. Marseille-P3661]|uniref:5-bromo-4-chloroindolyl phosphate hydrolysis family protein n=1 Tax=Bacillus sp. Marseille-P3661 TaxID=1936234 RepID=UPI000C83DC41|nr:5-bromo-4-chloroindolyl phosphate hydrolysis family protein [Bacillus sp. Marseille-P3661]
MKSILKFIFRGFIATNITILTGATAWFGFEQSFLISIGLGALAGITTQYMLKWRDQNATIKQNQLTKKEYKYIQQNLKEASTKIKRFNKALLGIRSISAVKKMAKLQRMVYQIYQIVKKEPKRFFQADRFFFYHLDTIVELSERYILLVKQPVNDPIIRESLKETEQTLDKLVQSLETDLLNVLANDIHTLKMGLDVAKQTFKQEQPLLPNERINKR